MERYQKELKRQRREELSKKRFKNSLPMIIMVVFVLVLSGITELASLPKTQKMKLIGAPKQTVPSSTVLDVDFIGQGDHYPTGCESVSAVMALQNLGLDISVDQFIDDYLIKGAAPTKGADGQRYGCDPRNAFPGSPYSSSGWGCYAPVIVDAVNKYIDGNIYGVKELSGIPLAELCQSYIDNFTPVLVWTTRGMAPAGQSISWTISDTGERFDWIYPFHCVLLVGYDSEYYYFNDPLEGKNIRYERSLVEKSYAALSMQAVVIEKK